MNTIQEFIKALRQERGINQSELADILNVSQSTLSRWERGIGRLTEEQILLIADAFKIDPRNIYAFLASSGSQQTIAIFRVEIMTRELHKLFLQFIAEQDPSMIKINQLSEDKLWM
ncbi:MAG: helix-turn-helix domain-containing protein [Porphyromonas sp.]|uniref:helix-turn-helix domain-containing protein n=1 Tax=Porphyromonas TaxID=836 RepID=UPI0006859D0C|nr:MULTISPECIES: helix-turn-helix domain-containing protein [Porphyromonas]MBL6452677.1 helix-turn-helix domain-containing protein [Porphyromonas sp.]